MPIDELHRFLMQVKNDPNLKAVISQTEEQKLPAVISELASKTGLDVQPDDVQQWMKPPPGDEELEEAQLDAVVGGATYLSFSEPSPSLKNLDMNFGLFVNPSHPQPTWPGNLP